MADIKKYAIIAAGGSGVRMGSSIPKQFLLLHGKTVLWYCLNIFLEAYEDLEIILVLPEGHIDTGRAISSTTLSPERIHQVQGGVTRFHSVKIALEYVEHSSIVFIHDAVRCLVTSGLIKRCYDIAVEKGTAIPGIAPVDSLRIESSDGFLPLDRNKVRIIQTPQTFRGDLIKRAYQQDYLESFTDDATVVEKLGVPIYLTEGEEENIKVTRPLDLLLVEEILRSREGK
jgi:2-C-methyl-D-erythritol 4-phosphate cytidylyltransferase